MEAQEWEKNQISIDDLQREAEQAAEAVEAAEAIKKEKPEAQGE